LKCGKINFNDKSIIERFLGAINELVKISSSYYSLRFKPQYYFEVAEGPLPSERGYYVILEENGKPLYVGRANDLNGRLNTDNGTLDNFADKSRASDSERNFIKKFNELNLLTLKICIIKERDLCSKLGVKSEELLELDRKNIEKIINIFRHHFDYIG
jgi:hypothetical protein